jgi:L-iditol 2-dehydrogenase
MVAHESQLYVVPDSIDDHSAVLTEPLSVGVHAVLQSRPDPAAAALVIGSGPIALATVWALRALGHTGSITAQTKRPNEAELARELGASATVPPGDGARAALLATGATAYRPIIGPDVFAGGGYRQVFDCVGSKDSLEQAFRSVAPRGKISLLGCASEVDGLDLTFLWAREIQLIGFVGCGMEFWRGERLHTFTITHRLLSETTAPVAKLVTHTYPLPRYREALAAASHRSSSGALKVLLRPT